jgi:hypothetical protein
MAEKLLSGTESASGKFLRADTSKPLKSDRIMTGQNQKAENAAKPNTPVCFVFMILPGHDSVASMYFPQIL